MKHKKIHLPVDLYKQKEIEHQQKVQKSRGDPEKFQRSAEQVNDSNNDDWEFLEAYLNTVQRRFDSMKSKISEAKSVKTVSVDVRVVSEGEGNVGLEISESKDPNPSLGTVIVDERDRYERPRAQQLAENFKNASMEHYSNYKIFSASVDPKDKAFRLKMKMTINRRINQITSSRSQVLSISKDMIDLYYESINFSKSASSYCILTMVEKILDQSETQVSLHPPSAFPLAQVLVEIYTQVADVSNVFMNELSSRCCFAVPRYPKSIESGNMYKIALGYKTDAVGAVIEKDSAFFERMCGLITLFAAVVQTLPFSGRPNTIGFNYGWSWLAGILNLPPRPITPLLICAFIETCAFKFFKKYGVNFEKLIIFIRDKYIEMIPKSSIAARTRLELLCSEVLTDGRFSEAKGMRLDD